MTGIRPDFSLYNPCYGISQDLKERYHSSRSWKRIPKRESPSLPEGKGVAEFELGHWIIKRRNIDVCEDFAELTGSIFGQRNSHIWECVVSTVVVWKPAYIKPLERGKRLPKKEVVLWILKIKPTLTFCYSSNGGSYISSYVKKMSRLEFFYGSKNQWLSDIFFFCCMYIAEWYK